MESFLDSASVKRTCGLWVGPALREERLTLAHESFLPKSALHEIWDSHGRDYKRFLYFVMWRRVVWNIVTSVSKKPPTQTTTWRHIPKESNLHSDLINTVPPWLYHHDVSLNYMQLIARCWGSDFGGGRICDLACSSWQEVNIKGGVVTVLSICKRPQECPYGEAPTSRICLSLYTNRPTSNILNIYEYNLLTFFKLRTSTALRNAVSSLLWYSFF
jgi:hypothetical protein